MPQDPTNQVGNLTWVTGGTGSPEPSTTIPLLPTAVTIGEGERSALVETEIITDKTRVRSPRGCPVKDTKATGLITYPGWLTVYNTTSRSLGTQ